MKNTVHCDSNISGKYQHFKGNVYDLYCVAIDRDDNEYVLYQQCYGDKSFWIRPYEMFFGSVALENGDVVPRFAATNSKRQRAENKIKKLIGLIEKQELVIHHSENEEEYIITNISESLNYVMVHSSNRIYSSGYLTEYALMYRLGYNSCQINGEMRYFKCKEKQIDAHRLFIGKNNIDELKRQINPCSIDLQIADSGYLRAKRKLIDPQSIETVSTAMELWKPVRIYKSIQHPSGYIKLRPGNTVLTHTKEKIKIPYDCAAKIEIKSTYARLSLDITSGDFCNPGYYGYYPLEITNRGKHTVILHTGETMAQLMLIPLQGPILENYPDKATFKNKEGYDDGMPYTFWMERSIKALRKRAGTEQIIVLYQSALNAFNAQNTTDINGVRDRFKNGFLPFCQKKLGKAKYQNQNTALADGKKLLTAYSEKEKRLKALFSCKWITGALTIFTSIFSIVRSFSPQIQQVENVAGTSGGQLHTVWPFVLAAIFFLGLTVFLVIRSPKVFCTFESIDIEKL